MKIPENINLGGPLGWQSTILQHMFHKQVKTPQGWGDGAG